ncbi:MULTISPECIES: autotransporter outer membrane beta-barrel domain-containing protein [unclassified Achromobacter]|uniref:autotransporter family protein n=1 Tax=unclassified Achromobacter TaxID=2626865 RepID=UPI001302FAC3|nr:MULTISPECIES: autotransporter outer membrane beta-barrel domain-containing protein [unclassified Achromobacter]
MTVPTGGSDTVCILNAGESIIVNGPIAPPVGAEVGLMAPTGAVGRIDIETAGSVLVQAGGSTSANLAAVAIDADTLANFSNQGTIKADASATAGLFGATAVRINNTHVTQDVANYNIIQSNGGSAIAITDAVIDRNFYNGGSGVISSQPGPRFNFDTISFNNVSIGDSFDNDGTIQSDAPGLRSVVRFTDSHVQNNVWNNGTMQDLVLSNTVVDNQVTNFRSAGQFTIDQGSKINVVDNFWTGTLEGIAVADAEVTNGVSNEGTITSTDGTIRGLDISGATILANGISNTGTILNYEGIVVGNVSNVTGGIKNGTQGKIVSSGNALQVTDGSVITGDISNDGTLTSTSGNALIVDSTATVTGAIRNTGEINGINGVSLRDHASVTGDIVNDGTISGSAVAGAGISVRQNSTVGGAIVNHGTVSSGIVVDSSTVTGGIVNTGMIAGNGSFIAVDVANALTPLTITNTGTIGGDVRLGDSTLDINGGVVLGSIMGSVTGTSGTVNFNTDYTSSTFINVQYVNVAAGKTLTLADSEIQGKLSVAGTLAGSGNVGAVTLQSTGVLSPGSTSNPIGTFTVNGDLVFVSGSTYRVDATDDGSHDNVHVLGAATLAGSVLQIGSNGSYAPSTNYTIITADGGLQGRFDQVTSNLAYLSPTVNYVGNDVVMNVALKEVPVGPGGDTGSGGGSSSGGSSGGGSSGSTRPIRFADLALSGNQRAAANALQSLPTGSNLYLRVLNLPEGAPAGVFNDLAGESHASTVASLQRVTNNVMTLPMSHLRANLNAGWLPGPATAQVGTGDASTLPKSAAQPMWAQVFGNWRTADGNDNASKAKQTDGGLFVGGDHALGNGWRLGGALGYTDSHISIDNHSASTDVDSYSATIYGGKAFDVGSAKLNLTAGAAYTWHDLKSKRGVNAAGDFQELKADYSANTSQIFAEVGYAMPLTDRFTLEPFVGADYSDLRTRGFSESGGDAALMGRSDHSQVATTTLGLHAQTAFEVNRTAGRLRGTVGWRHAYGDVNPETTMSFDGSQAFTVAGAPLARDAAVVELGVDMAMSKFATIGLAYAGQFGSGNQQNTGSVNLSWRF